MPLRALREGITSKNMITKQELIDFYVWCLKNNIDHNIDIRIEKAVDKYLAEKSIKSSADNIEICRCINKNCMHHKGGFCMAKAWDCKDRQIDDKVTAIDV